MAASTDMNVVLGQSSAVKEVQNIRKQSLEINKQFIAQQETFKRKEAKSRIEKFETKNDITIRDDREKNDKENPGKHQRDLKERKSEDDARPSEGEYIDIRI